MRVLSLLTLVTLAGCSGGDDSGETGEALPRSACTMFGPAGGELELLEATLRVPAGALDGEVELCLETDIVEAPSDYTLLSEVYTVTPTVVTFTEEVTMSITARESDDFVVGYFSASGDAWLAQLPTQIGNLVELTGTRGGSYAVAELGYSVEQVEFGALPPQDILFVMDDSCSMAEEQAQLAPGFDTLFDFLAGVDWHLAVVSTDMVRADRSGKLVVDEQTGDAILDSTDDDPEARFARMVSLGTDGDADEKGQDAAYAALVVRAEGANKDFLREDSGLTVVFISDEDDYSTESLTTFPEFLDARAVPPQVFSIVGQDSGDWNSCSQEAGSKYVALSAAYPGGTHDICGVYEDALVAIGSGIQSGGGRVVELTLPAQVDTIEVSVIDAAGTETVIDESGWVYRPEKNQVALLQAQEGPFTLSVKYLPVLEES